MDPGVDVEAEYRRYLERFETQVGPCEPGVYAKFRGRLIKKLRADDFPEKWREYQEAAATYEAILTRGDTINDVIARVLRERCDELVLERAV